MKETKINILIVWLLLSVLSSCSNRPDTVSNPMEIQFSTAVPITNMNKSLELKANSDERIFHYGSRIEIKIQNKSRNTIFFPEDTFVKLLFFTDGKWIEVQNKINYSGSIVLSPQGTPLLDSDYTLVKPMLDENVLSNDQKELPLRIVVTGEIMKNDVRTEEFVGAYVDVYIIP